MTIRGKASLGRAGGLMVAALLVAACGAPTASTGAGAAGDVGDWRVHADSLETGTPAPYGSVEVPGRVEVSRSARAAEPVGPCPDSGMRVTAGDTNAAMGLRALTVTLDNCGEATFELYGYPRLDLKGEDGTPVEGVRVLEGTGEITTGQPDSGPARITVGPGEAAHTVLVWRNTYDDTRHPPVTVDRFTVDPRLGRGTPTVRPDAPLDLGSTGRLGTTAWRKA
ncbi:DUF4232 domain-containing protein [Streptomyces kunmingensis]|uniref:DUF4232 domain-containing protein n=1 Tax=Streptomyces kunmingensis TaxID=68225 RepID=A0ABU6CJP1_9ACTN|nr:DUF4232 domain-containing protein [Streptomyces kunmingensis]MEB3964201.1 DUF4232 domain-containing protein [Streptomyces kunmingensis]